MWTNSHQAVDHRSLEIFGHHTRVYQAGHNEHRPLTHQHFRQNPRKVTSSSNGATLFVGDISILCNEDTIHDLFSPYGSIESIELKKSDRDPTRAHLSYGFVKFFSPESAELAMKDLNGKFVQGRCLRVGWADANPRGGKGCVDKKKINQTAQIHVIFVCKDMEMISELELGAVFGRFDNLVDIAIKKNDVHHVSDFDHHPF